MQKKVYHRRIGRNLRLLTVVAFFPACGKIISMKSGKVFLFLKKILNEPATIAAVRRFCILSGLFLYTELLFQIMTGTIGNGFYRAVLFILIGSALLTFITLCIPKTAAFILMTVALFIASLLSITQLIYISIFHEFLSIDMMGAGADAIYHFREILVETIRENIFRMIFLTLPVLIIPILFIFRRFPSAARSKVKYVIVPVFLLIALRYSMLIPVAVDLYSPLAVRYGQGDDGRITSVSEIGLFPTMEIDLLSQFFASDVSSVLDEVPELSVLTIPFNAQHDNTQPQSQDTLDTSVTASADDSDDLDVNDDPDSIETPELPLPPPPWEGKFNGFDIDFEALIERDRNSRGLLQLHEYFSSLEPSAQNEMTGLFEGYNLITICAEAFTGWVIDPELTPTLYMMQNEGVNFERFYSIYGAGTIGGEFALVGGFMPRGSGGWVTGATRNYLPFTFASRFLDSGIQPLAYHNGAYTFYDRDVLFPRLGYDFKAYGGGLDMSVYGYSTSDLILIKKTIDEYIDMDRFYVHYMTFSGHSGYSFGNPQARVHRDKVEHLPNSNAVKAYISCQLEFEYAMEYLLERLEEAGIAERTVIVITSDHYPYGLDHDKTEELAGKSLDRISELYESAGIIYVKGMEPVTVTTPAYVPDMTPTVLNLLGMPFDSRFLPGRDVFSDAFPFVILGSSIVTEAGVYNRHNRTFKPFDGFDDVPAEYITAIVAIDAARKSAVEQIVQLNYMQSIREYLS